MNLLPPPQNPDLLVRATGEYAAKHTGAKLRSFSSHYNCMGMIFAARRCQISPDQLPLILSDDEYIEIRKDELQIGDVVIYGISGHNVHVASVVSIAIPLGSIEDIRVLSKWGECGEFEHSIADVPTQLGTPTRYFTDRKPMR